MNKLTGFDFYNLYYTNIIHCTPKYGTEMKLCVIRNLIPVLLMYKNKNIDENDKYVGNYWFATSAEY